MYSIFVRRERKMKIYFISLGCAKNKVDSEMIIGLLEKNKNLLVEDPREADILMVNTCAFIESARKEAIDTILDLASYKTENKKLIVVGCLSQRYYDEITKLIPEVDRFIRIDEYGDITTILNGVLNSNFKGHISPLDKHVGTPNYMRYIKIAEGCLNRCAFCAIPLIRGRLNSRTIESITDEVRIAVSEGAYEINLISQDTTKYGYDLYHKNAIVDLLKSVCSIEGDFRVRLLYLYPDIVTDELIDFIKNNHKVMPYFDIPIQHSEDKLLDLMKRRGNREYLINLCHKIRKEIPNAILRTTLIVGFPYETREDVNNLLDFMSEIKFDRLGAFTFSSEEGTLAATYPEEISEDEKQRRYELVMQRQEEISEGLMATAMGKEIDCFITGYDENEFMYTARNYAFAPDDVDGMIYVAAKDEHELGDRIKARIVDYDAYSFTAEEV